MSSEQECFNIIKQIVKPKYEFNQIENHYEVIQVNNDITMLVSHNQIFYFNHAKSLKQQAIIGKLFQTKFDADCNPNFVILEGKFEIDRQDYRMAFFLNDDDGIEYSGKSNTIKNRGKFMNGRFIQNVQVVSDIGPKTKIRILITDASTGEVINQHYDPNKKREFKLEIKTWIKFNQQLNERDMDILNERNKLWVTSSILDAYCVHLNRKGEEEYFRLDKEKRKNTRRILFFQSNLTTSIKGYSKPKELIENELLEYQQLNYKINLLYHSLGFVINQNQSHWQFWLFDLDDNTFYLFDSLYQNKYDKKVYNEIINFFGLEGKIKMGNLPQLAQSKQNDGYSCGLHVSNFMYYAFGRQFNKDQKPTFYSEYSRKFILRSLIQNNEQNK